MHVSRYRYHVAASDKLTVVFVTPVMSVFGNCMMSLMGNHTNNTSETTFFLAITPHRQTANSRNGLLESNVSNETPSYYLSLSWSRRKIKVFGFYIILYPNSTYYWPFHQSACQKRTSSVVIKLVGRFEHLWHQLPPDAATIEIESRQIPVKSNLWFRAPMHTF